MLIYSGITRSYIAPESHNEVTTEESAYVLRHTQEFDLFTIGWAKLELMKAAGKLDTKEVA